MQTENYNITKKTPWDDYFKNESFLMKLMKWTQRRFLAPKFAEVIRPYIRTGDKILEAGCGTAINTLYICSLTGARPYVLDISKIALNEACKIAARFGLHIETKLADIRKMPFPDKSFDVCWNQGVLEHYDNTDKIISEMARVGKVVFVAVPRRTPLRRLAQAIKGLLGLTVDGVLHLYTQSELLNLMSQVKGVSIKASGNFNCLLLFSWTWVCGTTERRSFADGRL